LTHYTDYTIGHVHAGGLGWNGFMAFGVIYYLMPKLWKVSIYSSRLVMAHFWLATIGIVLYITSMWVAGITQGLMWWAFNPDSTLKYPEFVETVVKLIPFYWIRLVGGLMYLTGALIMGFNVVMTVRKAAKAGADLSDPEYQAPALTTIAAANSGRSWHHRLEGKPVLFTVLVLLAVIIGGPAQYIPMVVVKSNVPSIEAVKPYTVLELEGRDIYIREGCYNCHSQMIRPFDDEYLRYGEYTKPGETVYDHPFQFGSKRTGPDLARVGGKYIHFWHYRHMLDPRSTTPGSIMPAYPWLFKNDLDLQLTSKKLAVMQKLGVPYSDQQVNNAVAELQEQSRQIVAELREQGAGVSDNTAAKEVIALIAYLQRLGKDTKVEK